MDLSFQFEYLRILAHCPNKKIPSEITSFAIDLGTTDYFLSGGLFCWILCNSSLSGFIGTRSELVHCYSAIINTIWETRKPETKSCKCEIDFHPFLLFYTTTSLIGDSTVRCSFFILLSFDKIDRPGVFIKACIGRRACTSYSLQVHCMVYTDLHFLKHTLRIQRIRLRSSTSKRVL